GTSFNPSGISPTNAAMFQVAIWDILYNKGSATATGNTQLNFTNPDNGLTQTNLQNALTYANQDYSKTIDPTKIPAIQALVATDGSQNQAIYLGGFLPPPPTPAPLPAAANAGLALLGCVGLGAWVRRRRRIACALH